MVVVNPNQLTKEVLEIAGLSKVWTICASRSEGELILAKTLPPVESGSTDIVISILSWIAAGMALIVLAARPLLLLDLKMASIVALAACGISIFAGLISGSRDKGTWRIFSLIAVVVSVCIAVAVIAEVI